MIDKLTCTLWHCTIVAPDCQFRTVLRSRHLSDSAVSYIPWILASHRRELLHEIVLVIQFMKKDFFLSFLKNLSLFGPCPKRLTRGVLQPRSLFYECRSFFRFRKYFLKLRVHPGDEVAQRSRLLREWSGFKSLSQWKNWGHARVTVYTVL